MKMISFVLPSHNEEENIALIYNEIKKNIETIKLFDFTYEVIFVDDGSTDNTAGEIRNLIKLTSNVRIVQLSRNFGHQAALMAGLIASRGEAVISMDCDLQHPPLYIPEMISIWKSGGLVIEMKRKSTEGISYFKNLFSVIFYKGINKLGSVPIRKGVSDFRLLDRFVVNYLIKINDPKPFIRGLIAWLGFESKTIEYVADERRHGVPSYTFRKSLRLAHQALMSLSHEPLRFSIYISMSLFFLCIVYLSYVVIATLFGAVVPGWPSVIISVLVLGAIQMMSLGLLGEYVAQIFERSRNLPAFVALPENSSEIEKRTNDE